MASPDSTLTVAVDDPLRPDVIELLEEHLADMRATSPPESVHALDPASLAGPSVVFFSARMSGRLVGCAALSDLGDGDGELKSMRTVRESRGLGIAGALLGRVLEESRSRSYRYIRLETGTEDYFAAARSLYAKFGFEQSDPFGLYRADPHSVYMSLEL